MKSKLFVLVLALLTCLSGSAFAESPPPPAPSASAIAQAFTPEEMAKMRETLNQLSKAMGTDTAPSTPVASAVPAASADPPKKTTMADVANKALDMMGAGVAVIASNLQKIAPHVWRIMIIQQYAKAAYGVAEPFALFLGGLIFMLVMRKMWKPEVAIDTSDETKVAKYIVRSVLPTIYLIAMGLWLAVGIGESVKYVINPEYYAVKDILTLVSNPTQAP